MNAVDPARRVSPSTVGADNDPPKGTDVSDMNLIVVSNAADEAFQGFDWTEHDGKGVRLFIQGFG